MDKVIQRISDMFPKRRKKEVWSIIGSYPYRMLFATDIFGIERGIEFTERLEEKLEFFLRISPGSIKDSIKKHLLNYVHYLLRWKEVLDPIGRILGPEYQKARLLEIGAGNSHSLPLIYGRSLVYWQTEKEKSVVAGSPLAARVLGDFGVNITAVDPDLDPTIEDSFGIKVVSEKITPENATSLVGEEEFDLVFSIWPYESLIFPYIKIAEKVLKPGGLLLITHVVWESLDEEESEKLLSKLEIGKMRAICQGIEPFGTLLLYRKRRKRI